ncbi:MAG: M20 family metallo-hydrolase [Tissierellia bacterium]|nr:M20 family metallo-hydrolase [Tissierellia bacterium]
MKINMERVKKDIENLSSFNSTPGRGVTRLSFSKEDSQARDYLKTQMIKAGLEIYEDGYGSLFGRLEGVQSGEPTVMIGSHYDTVINAGPFDGVVGVIAGIEIARVLQENNIKLNCPLEIAAFNDEEGIRFGKGISNSRALTGDLKEEELDKRVDVSGKSLRDAMIEYGIEPDLESAKRKPGSIKSFLELHIEQGPILSKLKKQIGLVETILGYNIMEIKFRGRSGHAGTTSMDMRNDALVVASRFVLFVNDVARKVGGGAVSTVGQMEIRPNASNVIPQYVKLTLDVRADKQTTIDKINALVVEELEDIGNDKGIEVEMKRTLSIPPVDMSKDNLGILIQKSEELGLDYEIMNSGAAHDAMIMSKIAPSSLVFVPSVNGLSHHPEEWTEYDDIVKGIQLLLLTTCEICK